MKLSTLLLSLCLTGLTGCSAAPKYLEGGVANGRVHMVFEGRLDYEGVQSAWAEHLSKTLGQIQCTGPRAIRDSAYVRRTGLKDREGEDKVETHLGGTLTCPEYAVKVP